MQVKYARLRQVFNGGLNDQGDQECIFSLLDPIHVFQHSVWIKTKQTKTNKQPLILILESGGEDSI